MPATRSLHVHPARRPLSTLPTELVPEAQHRIDSHAPVIANGQIASRANTALPISSLLSIEHESHNGQAQQQIY